MPGTEVVKMLYERLYRLPNGEIRRRRPQHVQRVLERAEQVLANRFSLLGHTVAHEPHP